MIGSFPLSLRSLAHVRADTDTTYRKFFLLALVLLIMASASVRLLTFDRYLPFLEYSDEINMYLLARDQLGVEHDPIVPDWLRGYPPFYVWINIAVQKTVQQISAKPWIPISDYYFAARLLAAFSGVATTALVAGIGWSVGGSIAGFFAGLVWGLAPIIVDHNSLAIPDPFVYLTCATAIFAALRAWRWASPKWAFASIVAGIVAVYLKYPAVYALIPGGLIFLNLLYRRVAQTTFWLALAILVGCVAGAYLIWGYGAFELQNREANTVLHGEGLAFLLSLSRNRNNWYYAIYPIGSALFWSVLVASVLAYIYSARQGLRTVHLFPIATLLIYCIIGIAISASFSNVWLGAGKIRHTLPLTVAVIGLWTAAVAQIVWTLQDWSRQSNRSSAKLYSSALTALIALAFLIPATNGLADIIAQYRLTDTRVLLQRWSNASIPADGRILMHPKSELGVTWNRNWSGYDGAKPFDWWFDPSPAQSNHETFIERGITYFAASQKDLDKYFADSDSRSFFEKLTLVKTIHSDGQKTTGPEVYFYRFRPIPNATTVVFGERIALIGYEIDSRETIPGNSLYIRPYWRATERPMTNYSMFVHLYPIDEIRIIAQNDGPPGPIDRPTLLWDDPGEIIYGPEITLEIPPEVEPGQYRVAIGLYDYVTLERVTLNTGSESFTIPVTIKQPG